MAEDDEDVIFENSPLYKHLSEVGFTDFDVETLINYDEPPELFNNGHLRPKNGEQFNNRSLKERALNLAKKLIFGYLLPSTVPEEISCYCSCVAMIKSAGLLADDDLELLYRYEQCTEVAIDNIVDADCTIKENNNNKFAKANSSIVSSFVTSKFMTGIILLTAIILGFFFTTNSATNLKLFSHTVLSILFVWLILQLYMIQQKNKIYILRKNMTLLVDYTKFTEKFLLLIRKVILFLQEKELIARGHIIVNPAAPVTRLEPQMKQGMMLRKCLFIEMNHYLGVVHNNIKEVSDSAFLNTDYGNLNWLQKELRRINVENENDFKVNEYSLMTLKKAFASLGSKQSLLLCCIALNLMAVIIDLQRSQRKKDNSCQFFTCLGELLNKGKKCFDNLSECYRFHKIDIPAQVFDRNQGSVPSNSSEYSPLTLAVRSMTLHLQQTCKTSIQIEENLDKLNMTSNEFPPHADFSEIHRKISFLGQEIEKLNVCYEESRFRFEEIAFNSAAEQTTENMVEEKTIGSSVDHENKAIHVLNYADDVEPDSDQIFEGETASEYDDGTQYSPSLGREELLREEKAREESRHLLKELKSVLATKDEEKMVSIPKVLLKKFNSVNIEGVENSKVDASNHVPSCVLDSSESEMDLKSCMDKTKSYHCDSTARELAGNVSVLTNTPKNPEKSTSGSDDAANENSEVFHDLLLDSSVNDYIGQVSHTNPFASMVAAAAVARNRQFGVMEQSYEIEADTFCDGSDTD